jgi:hypothetical protein
VVGVQVRRVDVAVHGLPIAMSDRRKDVHVFAAAFNFVHRPARHVRIWFGNQKKERKVSQLFSSTNAPAIYQAL